MLLSRLPRALRASVAASAPSGSTSEGVGGRAGPPALETVAAGSSRTAAVALALRPPPDCADPSVEDADVLLIRRAVSRRDPWSGHMALPGGRWEAGDATLAATAIRETWEETGLDPGAPIGSLPPVRPATPRLPPLTIWPFVFRAPASAQARAASPEVASAHWLSIRRLRDKPRRGVYRHPVGGESRSFPCFRFDGHVVWGLTYRILDQFLATW